MKNRKSEEIKELIVNVARVTKVVKGGRRFSFSVLVVVGDTRGRCGFGIGKAKEVPEAISKATQLAKRSMVRIPLKEGRTVHYDNVVVSGSTKVVIRSAPVGTGIIAGGAMRAVFEVLGVKDVVAKSVGNPSANNLVRTTFKALMSMIPPKEIAVARDKRISDIVGRRNN